MHLDIKPSNIIRGARHASSTSRWPGPRTPGFASDVWGLGAILFEAVAGYRAFNDGDRDSEDLVARFPQLTEQPCALPHKVPANVAGAIHACLEADPAARPEPHELAAALDRRWPPSPHRS